MTVVKPPNEAISELARALGLDPGRLFAFTLNVERNEIVTVTATVPITDEQTKEMVRVVKRYNLHVGNGEQIDVPTDDA